MSACLSLITLTDSWKVTLFSARCSRGGASLASSAGRHPFCTHAHTNTHKKAELQRGSVEELRAKTDHLHTHTHTQVCTAVVQLILCSSMRQQELPPPEGSASQSKVDKGAGFPFFNCFVFQFFTKQKVRILNKSPDSSTKTIFTF